VRIGNKTDPGQLGKHNEPICPHRRSKGSFISGQDCYNSSTETLASSCLVPVRNLTVVLCRGER
jgi:hypothetical protein